MQQPKSEPTSLFIFRLACTAIFSVLLGTLMGMIYGPLNIPVAFSLGFGASILLRVLVEKQINYAYWWLRVWWELRVNGNDTR